MIKQEELARLDRNIKDAELRLKTFEVNINAIKKEVEILEKTEQTLEENIAFLKKPKTATLAVEYKKAKEDLKRTKIRIAQLKSDQVLSESAYKEVEKILKKSKEEYDRLTKQDDNNVVQGKFGRKRV